MKATFKLAIKASLLLAMAFLIGWISYWAGFSKALQIGLYVNQKHDQSQALEYDQLVAQLDSKKIEEVRAHLKGSSDILKEQASLQGSETNSVSDLLFPTGGLSLIRDYNTHRAKAPGK
ncbi:hypothetical protein [Luteibacter sahnii]|uniref:hypothetical protein n=1 Tax=Luteibacter sahnii TaxID=3021977 RepID=UPI002A6A8DD0|nr:hypothetical protein [Luteibacter sp. PPL193]MDY1547576.1 hypothetical protein [Luteibacter sp. PPL193]